MSGAQVVQPPFYDAPIVDFPSGQQHSQAWTEYHQSVADRLAANATALAKAGTGVVDGSNAAAGQIGEYLSASSGSVSLSNGTTTDIVTLALTPGDWDVEGNVTFTPTGAVSYAACSVSTVSASIGGLATRVPGASATTQIRIGTGGAVRISVSAAATAYLTAQSAFAGSMTATGAIRARRVR